VTSVDERTLPQRRPRRAAELFPIDLAVADYDRTRAIIDGSVKPDGIQLKVDARYIGDFCNTPVYEQYDVAEMSFSWYVTARSRGEPVVALPIFPLRMPVFAYVFVRADSPYRQPKDLIGARICTPAYRFTVNLWLRGIFREHYGLSPEQVTWVTCRKTADAGYVVPDGIRITFNEGGTPEQILARGDADAIFVPGLPRSGVPGDLRRLFGDAQAEMQNYARHNGGLPITHTIVMKQSLSENEPWIAESLVRAFMDSQRKCDSFWLTDPKHLSMGDAIFFLEQNRAAYGTDSWAQGFNPNRRLIDTFLRYAHDQGYTSRPLSPEDLFPPNTLAL
jgi:4,5-dihydroxyphthalate decarboxylase